MDSQKKLTLAWTVAGILAVLLVISLFFLMNQPKDLDTVLQEGKEDVTAQRDQVAEACNGSDAQSKARCQDELQELADILRDFSKDIDKATSTAAQNAQ
jgi:signal transduction histidine kinase